MLRFEEKYICEHVDKLIFFDRNDVDVKKEVQENQDIVIDI